METNTIRRDLDRIELGPRVHYELLMQSAIDKVMVVRELFALEVPRFIDP